MRRILTIAGLAAALGAAWPAAAQPGPPPRESDRPQPVQPAPPGRPADLRGREAEPPRRATMTPEERRDLRRDIRDHGQEVYRDRRPADRRPPR
jgi:hypothetical protein